MGIDIQQTSRHRAFNHAKNAGFGRNTGHIHMLFTAANGVLQDRLLAMSDRFYFDQRQCGIRRPGVAGKFGHCLAGMGVLVFTYPHIRHQFPFNHHFRMSNGSRIHRARLR